MTWREHARPIIAKLLTSAKEEAWGEERLKKALYDAYPYGQRQYHPYKIWLDEIRVQRGLKPRPERMRGVARERAEQKDPNQGKLFK